MKPARYARRPQPAQQALAAWCAAQGERVFTRLEMITGAGVHPSTVDLWTRQQTAAGALAGNARRGFLWRGGAGQRLDAQQVSCPLCGAPKGSACRTRSGRVQQRAEQQHRARTNLVRHLLDTQSPAITEESTAR